MGTQAMLKRENNLENTKLKVLTLWFQRYSNQNNMDSHKSSHMGHRAYKQTLVYLVK